MIEDKDEFIRFLDAQPLAESSKKTYHTWVNRLDEKLPKRLSAKTVRTEKDVLRLANLMPKDSFNGGHFKDVKCMIRYYLKFNVAKGVAAEQEAAESEGEFSPADLNEARKKVWRSIALRRGQRRFRDQLLTAYQGRV